MPLRVRDAITAQVTLSASTPLYAALLKLGYAPYGVVVDSSRVVGTIVRAELEKARAEYLKSVKSNPFQAEPKVSTVMRSSVVVLGPEMALHQAASILQKNQLVALPVVEDKRIVGVITLSKALDHLAGLWKWASAA